MSCREIANPGRKYSKRSYCKLRSSSGRLPAVKEAHPQCANLPAEDALLRSGIEPLKRSISVLFFCNLIDLLMSIPRVSGNGQDGFQKLSGSRNALWSG